MSGSFSTVQKMQRGVAVGLVQLERKISELYSNPMELRLCFTPAVESSATMFADNAEPFSG